MSRAKTIAAVTSFFVIFGIAGRLDKESAQEQYQQVPISQEDDPFWDCTVTGDYHCGEPFTNFRVTP